MSSRSIVACVREQLVSNKQLLPVGKPDMGRYPRSVSDPHVVAIRYRFVSANELDRFTKAVPMRFTADGFDLSLEGAVLTARPQAHFPSIENARAAIEPYLASWSAHARVEKARRDIRFEFQDADVIDRVDGSTVYPSVARAQGAAANAAILADNGVYPTPPVDFRTDEVLDALLGRLAELDASRTSVTDATYWVVTRIEAEFGTGSGSQVRQSAAAAIGVDHAILSEMGRLSTQNDPILGRKAKGAPRALTQAEKDWMRAAIVLVAGQIGALNAGVRPPAKTMADLPAM
jgi:hypothetical protein